MKDIIAELKRSRDHELHQIGLTPRTNFEGNQEDHDKHHRLVAYSYDEAMLVLKSKYIILDWMDGARTEFKSTEDAIIEFRRRKSNAFKNKEECDISCIAVLMEFNNIDK